jgi:HD superfamily phosphodiesterase
MQRRLYNGHVSTVFNYADYIWKKTLVTMLDIEDMARTKANNIFTGINYFASVTFNTAAFNNTLNGISVDIFAFIGNLTSDAQEQLDWLKDNVTVFLDRLDLLDAEMLQAQEDIQDLETLTTGHTAAIGNLQTLTTEHTGILTSHTSSITTLNTQMATAQADINTKANDNSVVHITGAESIAGQKTFSTGITLNGIDLNTRLTTDETNISNKANDNAVVHLTGTESIAGQKTFSTGITLNGTDLNTRLTTDEANIAAKANNNAVVHLTGAESIAGQKTFSTGITLNGIDLNTRLTTDETNISNKANDNAVVHLTGTESIAGQKTFSTGITLNGTDLNTRLTTDETNISNKANDNAVVHLTGAESIAGQKTFSTGITLNGTDLNTRLTTDETNISNKANDNAVVHITGAESIAGQKTFSTGITLNGTDLNTRLTTDETNISSIFQRITDITYAAIEEITNITNYFFANSLSTDGNMAVAQHASVSQTLNVGKINAIAGYIRDLRTTNLTVKSINNTDIQYWQVAAFIDMRYAVEDPPRQIPVIRTTNADDCGSIGWFEGRICIMPRITVTFINIHGTVEWTLENDTENILYAPLQNIQDTIQTIQIFRDGILI